MPGAKITERLDAGHYKGTVTVKVGPATMSFRGEVEMKDVDAGARIAAPPRQGNRQHRKLRRLDGSRRAHRGRAGRAAATLVGTSEVSMSGKAAAFGGRMMNTVADQILKQFAANFAAQVGALQAERAAAATPDRAGPGAGAAPPSAAPPQQRRPPPS